MCDGYRSSEAAILWVVAVIRRLVKLGCARVLNSQLASRKDISSSFPLSDMGTDEMSTEARWGGNFPRPGWPFGHTAARACVVASCGRLQGPGVHFPSNRGLDE
jgi:hypothetical protein